MQALSNNLLLKGILDSELSTGVDTPIYVTCGWLAPGTCLMRWLGMTCSRLAHNISESATLVGSLPNWKYLLYKLSEDRMRIIIVTE